jgi:septal ring factor EnvC (AmiA/AmiB activator)
MIIMSKSKHEALRKDIEDFKRLIIKYQSLRNERDILIGDLDRQSKLLESNTEVLDNLRKKVSFLESENASLEIELGKKIEELSKKNEAYGRLAKNYYEEKGKVYSMQKAQAKLYIWEALAIFFAVAMLIVGTVAGG